MLMTIRDVLCTATNRTLTALTPSPPYTTPHSLAHSRPQWRNGFVDTSRGIGVEDKNLDEWWCHRPVADLNLAQPITVTPAVTCAKAVELLTSLGFDQLPVVADDNRILGVVTEGNLTAKLMAKRLSPSDSVERALFSQFRKVTMTTHLSELARIFDRDHFAVVTQSQMTYSGDGVTEKSFPCGVVSRIDLLRFIMSKPGPGYAPKSPGPLRGNSGGHF